MSTPGTGKNPLTQLDAARTEAREKSEVLIEALPWMQRFRDRIVVVKYGGNAMIDEELRRAFAADMVFMRSAGIHVVVVHGGGPQINEMLGRVGIDSEFRGGLRVTDADTMDIVRMVLVGQVGRELVGLINQHGPYAIGMSGEDARLFSAVRRGTVVDGEDVDLGHVGAVTDVRPDSIQDLLDAGRIPVISSIAPEIGSDGRPTGEVLNINADLAAAAIAQGLDAEKLVVLTDVEGLYANWPDRSSLIYEIAASQLREMLPELTAGMIPKAEALLAAVDAGVRTATMIDGRIEHAVLLEVFTTKGVGTMVRRDDYV
ncbi:acetylglutamate kinase [Brachybacterium hainanense]|uniref:Acetylglutamate kinase n=1 Tax=Brachybacterium hainanense TaxID=1541174 RepID=A0ABV6R7B8_9MICO